MYRLEYVDVIHDDDYDDSDYRDDDWRSGSTSPSPTQRMFDDRDRLGNSSSRTSIASSIFNSNEDVLVTVTSVCESVEEDSEGKGTEGSEYCHDCSSSSQPGSPTDISFHHTSSGFPHHSWYDAEPGWTDEIPLELIEAAAEEGEYLARVEEESNGEVYDEEPISVPDYPFPPEISQLLIRPILNLPLTRRKGNEHREPKGYSCLRRNPNSFDATPSGTSSPFSASALHYPEGTDHKPSQASLPVPSHAVLGHLCTSAIKDGIVGLASTSRYKGKFMTTIHYRPLT